MATDYGTDWGCFPDLDPSGGLVTGTRCVAEALARRITTQRGTLAGAPNYGIDIREALNQPWTEALASRLQMAIARECEKDDRVTSALADVSYDPSKQALKISLTVTLLDDTSFSFVVSVTALTIDTLG